MALTGVHITFSLPGVPAGSSTALPYEQQASQTMATAGTSTASALNGGTLLSLSASAPIFYAVGQFPDASASSVARRYYDPTFGREDILVSAGDKVAWVFA